MAASIAFGLLFLQPTPTPRGSFLSDATVYAAAGERRNVNLGDGIQAVLAPNSRILVTGHEIAAQGEVYFAVDHRAERPLTVHSGPLTVQDIGTRFVVRNDGGTAEVAVEEGRLSAMHDGSKVRRTVGAGQRLRVDVGSLAMSVDSIEPTQIADWRDGTLTFQNAPLALVAERLSLYSGTKVSVDQAIGNRRFSGDVAIGKGEDPAQSVAGILGIRAVHQKDGMRLRNP
ncbi:MAG: FecR domain-containing protein [Sphingomicrobium sp.]